jgi:hypothetical protein
VGNLGSAAERLAFKLHFDAWSEQRSNSPFHLRLTLPHAETSVAGWEAYYGCWFIVAALLKVFGRIGSIDVEPSIKWFHGHNKVHGFKVVRHFRREIDRAITRFAREYGDKKQQRRHNELSASALREDCDVVEVTGLITLHHATSVGFEFLSQSNSSITNHFWHGRISCTEYGAVLPRAIGREAHVGETEGHHSPRRRLRDSTRPCHDGHIK